MLNKLYEYIEDVKSGKIKTGIEIKQAVQRYEDDLLRKDIYFDEAKAIKAIKFISHLKHTASDYDDSNFILQSWQVFIVANIFGWVRKRTGKRRFRKIYIEVARKNGKTALCAAIALYTMVADGEAKAEVVLAANSREQSKIAFEAIVDFSNKLDPKEQYLKISGKKPNAHKNTVSFQNNIIKCVTNSSKLDGLNASCVILDEYHESRTNDMYNVLNSSQKMRNQPLFFIITTAGFNKKYPCYEYRTTCKEILAGVKEDDSQFIAIYSLDDNDKWDDPDVWQKSNPTLGTLIKKEIIAEEVLAAKNNVSLETGVKTKTLNMWCDTLTTWISDNYILKSTKKLNVDDIKEDTEVYVGIDLSVNFDITAVAYMWIQDSKYYFYVDYYLPEDSLNTVADREYYKVQYKKGNIHLINENAIDYNYILKDVLAFNSKHPIKKIFYDSYNAAEFVIKAGENGLQLEIYSQAIGNFNRPTKEFERLIVKGDAIINDNDVTRWMLSNVFLKMDHNGNCKPSKADSTKKIDGIIAMLQALGGYLVTPQVYKGDYEVTVIKW